MGCVCHVTGAQQMEAIIDMINESYCAHLQPPLLPAPGNSLLLDEADLGFSLCTSFSVGPSPHLSYIFTVLSQSLVSPPFPKPFPELWLSLALCLREYGRVSPHLHLLTAPEACSLSTQPRSHPHQHG